MKEDCIFCKIVAGEIPSNKIFEDDLTLAFEDLNPQMPVHVLVIPKDHFENIADGVPAPVLKAMADTVDTVAKAKGIRERGFRVITNTGDDACQSVHHFHLHVLGGGPMNDGNPAIAAK